MTLHALNSASDDSIDPEILADRVVEKLLNHPDFIATLASQLAAALATESPAAESSDRPVPDLPAPHPTEHAEEATAVLQSWVLCHRPDLISGDPTVWSTAIVAAATPKHAHAMFQWAFTSRCPSPFWRNLSTPIAAPRAGRGGSRHGHCAQLLAEYRASTTEDPDAPVKIDTVVSGIDTAVSELRVQEFSQQPVNARKNALAILRKHQWNESELVAIIRWAIWTKPHWRSNISSVPTAKTFTKIRGDWVSAGSPLERQVSNDQQAMLANLASGWVYHYSKRQSFEHMSVSPATEKNIRDCLTGADGADPVPADTIKDFVRWLCQTDNNHTAFLVDGVDFPPLAKVRRGIISMTTRSETSVAATNRGAAGEVFTTVDVSEV